MSTDGPDTTTDEGFGDRWTVLGEAGTAGGGTGFEPVLDAADLAAVTGWISKPEGWCRGAECIPASVIGDAAGAPSNRAAVVAAALGAAFAVDEDHRIAVIGNRHDAASTLESGIAPDVELLGLDGEPHQLFEQSTGKTLLVAFASWCGCRHDLPGWQEIREELADEPFDVVAVAIDESAADVAPFAEDLTYPVLVDTDRRFADAYGLTNVPTVIWLDEDRRVVREPAPEFPDDSFTEIHGVASGPHRDALVRWVREDVLPDEPDVDPTWNGDLSADQRLARAEFRLALELLRRGEDGAAATHIANADALAPDDFTIWRAGMKLTGDDPFGADFFERYTDYQQRHGGPLQVPE